MKLAWGAKVSPRFREIVLRRAPSIGADPSELMAAMAFETGRSFDPAKRNPGSSATGLLQFMRRTAIDLGTTVEDLARMTAEEQLDYVFRYFTHNGFAGRIGTLADLYMAILWPLAMGKPGEFVLFDAGEHAQAYTANRGVDVNKDGQVTKAEAASFVARLLEEGLRPGNVYEVEETEIAEEPTTQPAAPIDDVSVPARPSDIERIQQQEQPTMAPLLIGLAGTLFQAFIPSLQALITNKLGKATGDPAAAGQTSAALTQQLSTMLTDAAKKATGETSELQAVARVEADAKAQASGAPNAGALATAVAEDVASRLDAVAPFVDRLSKIEADLFAAEEDSRSQAAVRALSEPFDFGRPLAFGGLTMIGALIFFVCAIIIVQLARGQTVGTEVWAALTGIIGWVTAKVGSIYDYRFGSSRGSAAKDVIVNELARSGTGTGQQISAMPRGASSVTMTATK